LSSQAANRITPAMAEVGGGNGEAPHA
jgi:hypothetical protein